jgi:hypothetical protein
MDVAIRIDSKVSNGRRGVFWNEELSHHIAEDELQEVLKEARSNVWKSSAQAGMTLGIRLYHLVNGSGGQLQAAFKASYHQGVPLHIYLALPFALDALPFELLRNEDTFLLLESDIHLIRKITERNRLKIGIPERRALKLLFMACSPLDLPATTVLQFEKEEERVLQAVERFPVAMRIEDSGSLTGLGDTLYEGAHYDIVHLSGHAGIEPNLGPVFYMENEIGELAKITPDALYDTLKDFPPRVLFLSGCSTGKSDKVNASESFAHLMVEKGIPVVLGWGLPVADVGATTFAAEVYEYLAKGKGVDEAVQRARQATQESYHPWPLLRLFTDGSWFVPLIAPGQSVRPKTARTTTHKYLADSQVKVLEQGFVGRRRELQQGVRVLKGFGEKYGLIIRGPAGVGKSCLAGKVIERFPDKALIAFHGELRKAEMLQKLRNMFDQRGIAAGLAVINSEQEFEEKMKALFRSPFKEQPTLLLFDDFEQNLVRRGDDYYPTADCVEILKPVLRALAWSEGRTNLIITSRYPFTLEVEGKNLPSEVLEDITLASFRGPDLEKKKGELKHIADSPHADLFLAFGKGNPRLL